MHAVRLRRALLGGSPLGAGAVKEGVPLVMHAVRCERTLIGGRPFLYLRPLALGDPSLLLGHAMRWESTLPCGGVPPFLQAWPSHQRHALSVPCPPVCPLAWGVPPLLAWHSLRWECKLPYREAPPFPWL